MRFISCDEMHVLTFDSRMRQIRRRERNVNQLFISPVIAGD